MPVTRPTTLRARKSITHTTPLPDVTARRARDCRVPAVRGGFGAPHDIVYLPETNNLIVSDGSDDFGWAYLLSGTTYKVIDKIKLPNDVDEAVFDPKQKYFYIESGPAQPDGGKTHWIN